MTFLLGFFVIGVVAIGMGRALMGVYGRAFVDTEIKRIAIEGLGKISEDENAG